MFIKRLLTLPGSCGPVLRPELNLRGEERIIIEGLMKKAENKPEELSLLEKEMRGKNYFALEQISFNFIF